MQKLLEWHKLSTKSTFEIAHAAIGGPCVSTRGDSPMTTDTILIALLSGTVSPNV